MRRLRYLAGGLALLVIGTLVFVGGASADKPPPGSHPVRFTNTDPTAAGIVEPVYVVDAAGNLLPSASCGLALKAGPGTDLVASVRGWETDPDPNDPRGLRFVSLQADLRGTITDTAQHVYRVRGRFDQEGLQTWPSSQVPFDGTGQVSFVAPGGIVRGTAEFREVAEFPQEWDFIFSNFQICRPA